jgi:hypothetical protein
MTLRRRDLTIFDSCRKMTARMAFVHPPGSPQYSPPVVNAPAKPLTTIRG